MSKISKNVFFEEITITDTKKELEIFTKPDTLPVETAHFEYFLYNVHGYVLKHIVIMIVVLSEKVIFTKLCFWAFFYWWPGSFS